LRNHPGGRYCLVIAECNPATATILKSVDELVCLFAILAKEELLVLERGGLKRLKAIGLKNLAKLRDKPRPLTCVYADKSKNWSVWSIYG
jgi:hypothetical protein